MKQFKVKLQKDETYDVVIEEENQYIFGERDVVFSGSLADCEAYIRLTEKGYMN